MGRTELAEECEPLGIKSAFTTQPVRYLSTPAVRPFHQRPPGLHTRPTLGTMSILNTPELMKLWQDAQIHPEWATTRFWEYLFNQIVFSDGKWSVASQQPPTRDPDDVRRVDLVVERISDSAVLLFLEAKRAQATKTMVEAVESQAFTACCAKLCETGAYGVWAMTCIGTRTRLWAYKYNLDYLTAFYPSDSGLSELSEYVEISTHGRHILDGLDYIKSHPIPPLELFDDMPTGLPPAHAVLPSNGHDCEIALVAAASQGASVVGYSEAEAGPSNWEPGTPMEVDAAGSLGQPDQPQPGSLVAADCTRLVLEKTPDGKHMFKRPDGKGMTIDLSEWAPYYIQTPEGTYEGYGYRSKSGTQYYASSLEAVDSKSAGKKKKKKH